MTYREAIQSQVKKLEELYDNAEHLRDVAAEDEKTCWNNQRIILSDAMTRLRRLDNRLPANRASFKLKGKY